MADLIRIDGDLAVIGGGRMGEAIVRGLRESGAIPAERIVVAEPVADRRNTLAAEYGVRTSDAAPAALADAGLAILAVKPQVIDAVCTENADHLGGALVVSIAVGVTTARLESLLPVGSAVVRVMPNTPAMVGAGMSVVSGGAEASSDQVALVAEVFTAVGDVLVLDEQYQDAAAAVSGSGPAYMALVIDALARAGVRQGLPRDIAQRLAVTTMAGTAALIDVTGEHPEALIDGVTSPGGTTIAAIQALEDAGVRAAFFAAVDAAVSRAKELG